MRVGAPIDIQKILRGKSQKNEIHRLANSRFLIGYHKHLTKVLDFWFAVNILKSISRSGFSSGFLLVLTLFLNNVKYFKNKNFKKLSKKHIFKYKQR